MKKLTKIAKQKKISREIVQEITGFGVTEDQKIDIIYFLAMTLNDNEQMKEICNLVKKYKVDVSSDSGSKSNKKIIIN